MYYSYGSGMRGCMYDYGPNYSSTKGGAITGLACLFAEQLSEEEYQEFRLNLNRNGIHYFSNPGEIGAEYAEIQKHEGIMPNVQD